MSLCYGFGKKLRADLHVLQFVVLIGWLICTSQLTHYNFLAQVLCLNLIARMKFGHPVLEITVSHRTFSGQICEIV